MPRSHEYQVSFQLEPEQFGRLSGVSKRGGDEPRKDLTFVYKSGAGSARLSTKKALQQAAMADDAHSQQNLPMNTNDKRLLEKPGAGLLPKVQGPQIKIEPPVKEATKMQASPKE